MFADTTPLFGHPGHPGLQGALARGLPNNTHTSPGSHTPAPYQGPERRSGASPQARWLSLMLDEIDYGMVLLGEQAQVLHANHAAREELDGGHPLQLVGPQLRTRLLQDMHALQEALNGAAERQLRRMLALGEGEQRVNIAVIPLGGQATLVVLSKRQLSERISVQCFATQSGLTPAETRVLQGLCDGLQPREVATMNKVGLATVRTQIGAIRAKTGAENIRALVRQVAVLPPMVNSLRRN